MTRLFDILFASIGLFNPRLTCSAGADTHRLVRHPFAPIPPNPCRAQSSPFYTGLAQVQGIDMSTPEKLAQVDADMLKNLTLGTYLRYILQTVTGKGDRVKP